MTGPQIEKQSKEQDQSQSLAPTIDFSLNDHAVSVVVQPGARLSDVLREDLGQRDVKIGCNAGDCGACTILLEGEAVCACLTPAHQAQGRKVQTTTGLVESDAIAKGLAQAFLRHGAAQCGICTPAMVTAATALLHDTLTPSESEVQDALGGVLCRCTGYRKIINAVMDVQLEPQPDASPTSESGKVGDAIIRLDGLPKVMGEEQFGDDVAPAGALVVRAIRSPFHHASFELGDLATYQAQHLGIEAILTAKDMPGRNVFGVIPQFADQPAFAEEETRFRGEVVAAIVGEAKAVAALDLSSFPVVWTELDAALDVAEATAPEAALLHPERAGNVMCGGFVKCGNPQEALERATYRVEASYKTGFIEHAYIEPEAGFAQMVDGRLEVQACTQAPYMDRDSLAELMGLAPEDIRIIPTATGGGFGSKLDLSLQPYIALAALKTGKAVRMTYSRTDSMQSTTKRHPSDIVLKIGADAQGRICGFDFAGDFNTGAYASWGPTVANRVPVHASGPYHIPDYRAASRGIHTHCPPAGAFRGFGVPQSAIAQETLFDQLSEKVGMDKLEFRLLNALENGLPTVTGQVFEQGVGIKACLEALRPYWQEANAKADAFNKQASADGSPSRKGVGIASAWYGCGNTSLPNPSTIKAGITPEGQVVLHQGATDIGQGANTVIAQIFATALGIPVSAIRLESPDTDITPDAGKTSASRQTFVSGNAARLTGEALRATILRLCNASLDADISIGAGEIVIAEGEQSQRLDLSQMAASEDGYVLQAAETYDPPTKPLDENGQGIPYAVFGYAAHLVELEVDLTLGTVKLEQFVAAHDVGKAINPVLVEGQVEGGIAQGLGLALMEEYLPGRTENLHDYLIPTIGDVPPIKTLILEEEDVHGPYGAKGLGEHVLIPTAPAILNAIRHASGAVITQVPATPDRVLQAIKEASNDGMSA
ncbi:MAG: molybdopterin-dependent oxidoreductase [Cohaesibacter sp.]|jgi:CO/xanthine dehydrogenase Mo-binding subunit/aerobic-type carbon monoxide dehydrogenase small subunit (CoxS/CutS family)|nr:molybdopterin-dependent oxidoreductase [Cohaesibacter sp.]